MFILIADQVNERQTHVACTEQSGGSGVRGNYSTNGFVEPTPTPTTNKKPTRMCARVYLRLLVDYSIAVTKEGDIYSFGSGKYC